MAYRYVFFQLLYHFNGGTILLKPAGNYLTGLPTFDQLFTVQMPEIC